MSKYYQTFYMKYQTPPYPTRNGEIIFFKEPDMPFDLSMPSVEKLKAGIFIPNPPNLDEYVAKIKAFRKFYPLNPIPYKKRHYFLFPTEWPVLETQARFPRDGHARVDPRSEMRNLKVGPILSQRVVGPLVEHPFQPETEALKKFSDFLLESFVNGKFLIVPRKREAGKSNIAILLRPSSEAGLHRNTVAPKHLQNEPRYITVSREHLTNGNFWKRTDLHCPPELFFAIKYVLKQFRDVAELQDSLEYILRYPPPNRVPLFDVETQCQFLRSIATKMRFLYCNFRRLLPNLWVDEFWNMDENLQIIMIEVLPVAYRQLVSSVNHIDAFISRLQLLPLEARSLARVEWLPMKKYLTDFWNLICAYVRYIKRLDQYLDLTESPEYEQLRS